MVLPGSFKGAFRKVYLGSSVGFFSFGAHPVPRRCPMKNGWSEPGQKMLPNQIGNQCSSPVTLSSRSLPEAQGSVIDEFDQLGDGTLEIAAKLFKIRCSRICGSMIG